MPSELNSMSTSDADAAQEPKGKNREPQETASGDEGNNVPASEGHFSKKRTERDLSIRIALLHAEYDVSKLKDGAELDDAAKELLKAKTTRTRVVSRSWPRDPKGKFIAPDDMPPGRTTSNGVELWGATLLDFFWVRRIPNISSFLTLTTGSKLAAWMKKHGEKYAADEMTWTDMEDDPREVPPCDIAGLIESTEVQVAWKQCGESMVSKSARVDRGTNEEAEKQEESAEGEPNEKRGETEIKGKEKATLFNASSYPAPWPLIPFSYSAPTLQNYIPLNRLPKKLIVHDPWNLLSVRQYWPWSADQSDDSSGPEELGGGSEPEDDSRPKKKKKIGDWTKTPDITHVYKLKLSLEATERLEAEAAETAREGAELEKDLGPVHQGFLIYSDQQESGPIEPPVYAVYPPLPPPEPVEEAHLYISPAHSAGKGNHSIVYRTEWEVPRSMLMPYTICKQCVMEDVEEILKEEDGEDGSKKEARWKEKSAQLNRVPHVEPAVKLSLVEKNNVFETKDGETEREAIDTVSNIYHIRPGHTRDRMNFEGPVRPIVTRVPWVSPDASYTMACSHGHFMTTNPHPPTTKVKVMAKLSLPHDLHLATEAYNYQEFPKHMFEHWNGLNLVLPLHEPTPVGAVVPQFYGYYVPVDSEEIIEHPGTDTDSDVRTPPPSPRRKPYLSPIMLLEDCGVPLNPQDLNIDQKHECASLYYRFHSAGWTHGSVARRNILVQPGPLSLPPLHRCAKALEEGEEHSFRLIDFGRSTPIMNERDGSREMAAVAELFGHMGTEHNSL